MGEIRKKLYDMVGKPIKGFIDSVADKLSGREEEARRRRNVVLTTGGLAALGGAAAGVAVYRRLAAKRRRQLGEVDRDVQSAITSLPDESLSQALASRWRRLMRKFRKGNPAANAVSAQPVPVEALRSYGLSASGSPASEKQASARIDIPSVYDEVRKAYAGMGYPVSGDRLVVSAQPTYVDGRPVPKDVIAPNSSGGNTQDDGTVRINPRYRAVMRHWGLKGSGRDFLRMIIGHELGHHVDRTVLGGRSAERRRLLQEIARSGFRTVYTDSYGPDTDRRKLDKELLAEYLAKQVSDRMRRGG